MKDYLKVGLITFFVSLVLSGLLFTFSPERLNWLHMPITIAIIYPSVIISIMLAVIVIIANLYMEAKTFRVFKRGFLSGILVFFILTFLLFPTIPFFGLFFIDLLYLPGLVVAHWIIEPAASLIISPPIATSDDPFIVWPAIMISILFYASLGAFINIRRYRKRGEAEKNSQRRVK